MIATVGPIAHGLGLCRQCHEPIPKPSYSISTRQRGRPRLYCTRLCHLDALRARRLHVVGAKPLKILQARESKHRVTTWAQMPDACPRCHGLMKPMLAGRVCCLCGYDVFCVAALIGVETTQPGWA